MKFVDVIFPLNLGPLTYGVSEALKDAVRPGMLVRAEIKKTVKTGIVLGPALKPPGGGIKDIDDVVWDNPVLSSAMLQLITWMAGYYFSNEGSVLKGILPREFWLAKPFDGESNPGCPDAVSGDSPGDFMHPMLKTVRENIKKKYYKTFLLHAPGTEYELSFLLEAISGMRNIIVLCPGHAEIKHIQEAVKETAGERLGILHSGLSKSRRVKTLQRITSGAADIVLGSRSAVFAPLKEVSLIAVMHEESTSYKEERSMKYNARDIAVMRGYLEGASVLLSSICPSVESYHNATTGKYTLIETRPQGKPKVRIIDVRGTRSPVSRKLLEVSKSRIKKGEKVMFLINRKGYSMLQCPDCEHLEICDNCNIPLVFYKKERLLRCSYCGGESTPPETCPQCGGFIGPSGAGIERLEEELGALSPLLGVEGKHGLKVLLETDSKLVVGTKLLARRPELRGGFSMAGIVNADAYLYVPDFRSAERAFQDIVYTAEKIRPNGEIIIQTRNPHAALFRHIRRFGFKGFYKEELSERKSLRYPPFSRMALITGDMGHKPPFHRTWEAKKSSDVEVLGPVLSLTKRGKKVWKILIKARSRKDLQTALARVKRSQAGVKINVDVDPIFV